MSDTTTDHTTTTDHATGAAAPGGTDHTATVDAYVAMWNEADAGRRAALIERAWAEGGSYVDPLFEATGRAALNDMVTGARAQFPGHTVVRTSGIDAHHGLLRFGWELRDGGGAVVLGGLDVAIVAGDGRLDSLAGFFGPVPPAEAA